MNFGACRCDDEDGCEQCAYTRYRRQCDTCGDWFAAEHPPQSKDHDTPWSCPDCWATCHSIVGTPRNPCRAKAVVVALVWTEDYHHAKIGNSAVEMRLCRRCFESAKCCDRAVAGTVRELATDEGARKSAGAAQVPG